MDTALYFSNKLFIYNTLKYKFMVLFKDVTTIQQNNLASKFSFKKNVTKNSNKHIIYLNYEFKIKNNNYQ